MSIESINPFTEQRIESFSVYNEDHIEQALATTAGKQRSWAKRPVTERASLLAMLADRLEAQCEELAVHATAEMGKLRSEATAEIEKCAWLCRFFAEKGAAFLADEALDDDPEKTSFVSFEPLGVWLAIMPWNFPYWQVFRCIAPAFLAGNTCVLKHASNVSRCALSIEKLVADCEENLLRALLIPGSDAADLIADRRVQGVSVTGSERAGRAVGAGAGQALKPSVLELGGSDAFIVLDAHQLERTVENAVTSRFQNAGQSCIAAKRFIVLDHVYDEFRDAFVERAKALRPGDPAASETELAPMARADLREELAEQVQSSLAGGANLLCGGSMTDVDGKGYFYQPTVIDEVGPESVTFCEETFGPVAALIRACDAEDAIRLANQSTFGLGGSVWCADRDHALEIARAVQSGCVYVNRMMASDPRLPFGGIKDSGYGRELARVGLREFVNQKTISMVD